LSPPICSPTISCRITRMSETWAKQVPIESPSHPISTKCVILSRGERRATSALSMPFSVSFAAIALRRLLDDALDPNLRCDRHLPNEAIYRIVFPLFRAPYFGYLSRRQTRRNQSIESARHNLDAFVGNSPHQNLEDTREILLVNFHPGHSIKPLYERLLSPPDFATDIRNTASPMFTGLFAIVQNLPISGTQRGEGQQTI